MANDSIASVAEPWIMLPYIYATRKEGVLSEYGHHVCSIGINDFIQNLPNGRIDFQEELGRFISSLYEKQCLNGEKYFLDKTPRYYNIISELAEIFPDAKFIFLFRNPLQILSSIMNTWSSGSLRHLYANERDINYGQYAISEGYEKIKDRSHMVNYEEIVHEPERTLKEICDYLDISYAEKMLSGFVDQNTKGALGDSTGSKRYKKITSESTEKWKKAFSTPYRRKFAMDYIKGLDESVLKTQNYSKSELLYEVESIEVSKRLCFQDIIDVAYGKCIRKFKLNILFGKTASGWAKNKYIA